MRTKTLLIAAAALAVGVASSLAQTYSQNVVGYVNIAVTNHGYTLICTPVDSDGTGTNNTVGGVLSTNLPYNSIVEVWNGSAFSLNTYSSKTKSWGTASQLINPGLGYFIYNPSNFVVNLTVAGTVLQGPLTNKVIGTTGQYSLLGYMVPISGGVTTTFGYQPSPNDKVEIWNQSLNSGAGAYSIYTYSGKSKTWSPSEPQIGVAQGFFIVSTNPAATLNTNFTVQ